ncbi:hypothetical protein [Paenibacillus marinisediminis]
MKKNSKYIIILLSLIVVILGYKFVESQSLRKGLQSSIDISFRNQLSQVLGSFSMEVNDYTYRMMISSVSSAVALSELTSFEEINDQLDISLHYLYISLREEKSKNKVLSRTNELREIFNIMILNPDSSEATDRLIQIAEETFFNVED